MTSEEYITLIDWQAKKAESRWKESQKITVLVEDGALIHTSHVVKAKQKEWEKQGL